MDFFFSDNANDADKRIKKKNRKAIDNMLYGNLDHVGWTPAFQLTTKDGKNYTLDHTKDSKLWSYIILLKNDEDFEDLNVKKNEMVVRNGQGSAIQIIIKSEDPKVQKEAIKQFLKADISKDFRMMINS